MARTTKMDHLQDKIASLKQEMVRLEKLEVQRLEAPDQQIFFTDPDARSMATSGRGSGIVGYNVQASVDVFIPEPGTDRYLGRLCRFNRCPKSKIECLVPGCGATGFLQQHQDFQWRPESLAADRVVHLFDRTTGRLARAAELPLPTGEDEVADVASS